MTKRSTQTTGKDLTFDQYRALAEMEKRRECREMPGFFQGRQEPRSDYDGLYTVDEVDDGGRLIGARTVDRKAFVRVEDLPEDAIDALEEQDHDDEIGLVDVEPVPVAKRTEAKTTTRPASGSGVFRRRGNTLVPLAA